MLGSKHFNNVNTMMFLCVRLKWNKYLEIRAGHRSLNATLTHPDPWARRSALQIGLESGKYWLDTNLCNFYCCLHRRCKAAVSWCPHAEMKVCNLMQVFSFKQEMSVERLLWWSSSLDRKAWKESCSFLLQNASFHNQGLFARVLQRMFVPVCVNEQWQVVIPQG